jgi:hypothetical protein
MMISRLREMMLRPLMLRFHRDQSGAALTEFVVTLPIWITLFGGVVALGKLGVDTTANQLQTQAAVWDAVFAASTGKKAVHMSTVSGGGAAAAESATLATDGANPHQITTSVNGGVMTALAAKGSWGESKGRVLPLEYIPGATVPTAEHDPSKVLKVGSDYPMHIVNDGAANANWKSGKGGSGFSKIINMFGDALSGSGALAAIAAGNRYGEVYSATTSQPIDLPFGQSITATSHANLLVAPSPLKGAEANYLPFVLSRLMAEGEKNYSVMMNFGESEWKNTGASRGGFSDPTGKLDDEKKKSEEDAKREREDKRDKCNGDNPPADCASFCADYGC